MKHLVGFCVDFRLVIADDDGRPCQQRSGGLFWQFDLPERAYLAALDGLRWVGGSLPKWPRRDDWRAAWQAIQGDLRLAWMAMVTGGEYWQVTVG